MRESEICDGCGELRVIRNRHYHLCEKCNKERLRQEATTDNSDDKEDIVDYNPLSAKADEYKADVKDEEEALEAIHEEDEYKPSEPPGKDKIEDEDENLCPECGTHLQGPDDEGDYYCPECGEIYVEDDEDEVLFCKQCDKPLEFAGTKGLIWKKAVYQCPECGGACEISI